jgi:hypothetical protein
MEWATRVVDLTAAAPAFVPLGFGPPLAARIAAAQSGFAVTLPWVACFGAAAMGVAWWIDRRRPLGEYAAVAVTFAFAFAGMIAIAIGWRMQAAPSSTVAAQLDALRMLASSRVAAFDLTNHARLSSAAAWGMDLEIQLPPRAGRGGPRPLNRPLAVFPSVPAGSYVLQVRRRGGQPGWVMAGVGNDQFAIVTQPIGVYDEGVAIDLPVDVRAISIRSDEGARDQLQAVVLRPKTMSGGRLSRDVARRAVRYANVVAYFLDDRAFPDPSGFWVGGGRDTTLALHADERRASVTLTLRNGAAANRALLQSGSWRGDVGFGPGEERRIEVPLDGNSSSALLRIRSESGFRPADVDGRSKDTRYLGVFVKIE